MQIAGKVVFLTTILFQFFMLAGCYTGIRMDLPQDEIEKFRKATTASIHVYQGGYPPFGKKQGYDDNRFQYAKYMLECVGLNVVNAKEVDKSVNLKKISDVTLNIYVTRKALKSGRYDHERQAHEMGGIKISTKGGPSNGLWINATSDSMPPMERTIRLKDGITNKEIFDIVVFIATSDPKPLYWEDTFRLVNGDTNVEYTYWNVKYDSPDMMRRTQSYLYRLMEMIHYIYGPDPICKAASKAASADATKPTISQEDYYSNLGMAAKIFIEYEGIDCADSK